MSSQQDGRYRPAGIGDVARAAGVSVATASFALNGRPGVAEDTRRRIVAVAAVLWLNGHTHTNRVKPRRDPADPARGFWEVTTCAIVDWPCQARLVDAGE